MYLVAIVHNAAMDIMTDAKSSEKRLSSDEDIFLLP